MTLGTTNRRSSHAKDAGTQPFESPLIRQFVNAPSGRRPDTMCLLVFFECPIRLITHRPPLTRGSVVVTALLDDRRIEGVTGWPEYDEVGRPPLVRQRSVSPHLRPCQIPPQRRLERGIGVTRQTGGGRNALGGRRVIALSGRDDRRDAQSFGRRNDATDSLAAV
jgi:hypothetical protein